MEIFASKIDVWLYILQSLLQDISSHQRMVDSVVEKAQGVLQTTNNPDVAFLIKDISSRYEHIARTAKVENKWSTFDCSRCSEVPVFSSLEKRDHSFYAFCTYFC